MNEFSHHLQTDQEEHPFAETIRILGKGKKGSRALTQEEARHAMRMILADEVLPVQLGAFLMLMRVKEETPEEIAGFVQAIRESYPCNHQGEADLDWATYAGKRRHLPWFILSALLLAENGVRVFMHGATGPSNGRLYTENILPILGMQPATSIEQAREQLRQHNFSYLALSQFCPKLQDIIELRPLMGLRSPVHTLVRMLNPFNANYSIQGIFHPSYRAVHQEASALLQQSHVAVLKGEGGETERNPDSDCLVQSVHDGCLSDENWPALFTRRHVKPESLEPRDLLAVWQGRLDDEYAEATIVGTAAIALKLLGKAVEREHAQDLALSYWQKRDKNRFS